MQLAGGVVPLSGSVLALRALGVGDLLTAVPALRGLRRAFPDARTVLAAPEALRPLVILTGAVDRMLPTPGLGALRWDGPPPRLAVNLHGRGPHSTADLRATRPRELLAHRDDESGVDGPQWREDVHEVHRWCALLGGAGISSDPTDLDLPVPRAPAPDPATVVVHPGAASASRRWPADRFAAVARELSAAGHPVVVTGSGAEHALAAEVADAAGLGEHAVLAGSLGLTRLAALVAGAALVVCGDTGVAHLATAYRTPSVLLFGPTPPSRWGPVRDPGRHRVLWAGTTGDPHAAVVDDGLLRLEVDDVLAAAWAAPHRSREDPRG